MAVTVCALCLSVAGAFLLWRSIPAPGQPLAAGSLHGRNLLLVTIDTLRVDRVGAFGSTRGLTPHLDRLAAEGLRFETTYTSTPLTLPAHTSLMTGLYPTRHGVRDNGSYRFDGSHPTLAHVFQQAGYRTGAFVGAFVVDARFGLTVGFDRYDDRYASAATGRGGVLVERAASEVVDSASHWIAEQNAPWFAWVHFYDPHEPYAPVEPYRSAHADPYDGEVAYADAQLGRLLTWLDARQVLGQTFVVVAADHGESLGDHGERTHGLFAYDVTLRVPLVMSAEGAIRAAVVREPARLVDVMPTVLDLVGLPAPAGLDGQSLRPVVAGESPFVDRGAYFEALNANLTRNWAPLTGLVADGHKLVDLPVPELYDLRGDPAEQRNLYASNPERARRLERALDSIVKPPTAGAVDAETAARLLSLGYVAGQRGATKTAYTADDDPKTLVTLDGQLDEALEHFEGGDAEGAAVILQRLIAQRPSMTVAYDRLAQVRARQGRLTDAIRLLDDAARAGYADAPSLAALGEYLQQAGDFARSVDVLRSALALNPNEIDAYEKLGVTYTRMRRLDEARAMFDKVLSVDPGSAVTFNNLGALYLTANDVPRAIEALTRSIALDGSRATAHNGLGVAYARLGDRARAIAEWERAVALDPAAFDTLFNLGLALRQAGRGDEARPYLERFLRDAPRDRYGRDADTVRRWLAEP